jgi:hypothetical protein
VIKFANLAIKHAHYVHIIGQNYLVTVKEVYITTQRLNRKIGDMIMSALSNSTNYNCRLCGSFIVDTSRSRQDINAEIFHYFFDMHQSDVMLKAKDIFRPYLSMDN